MHRSISDLDKSSIVSRHWGLGKSAADLGQVGFDPGDFFIREVRFTFVAREAFILLQYSADGRTAFPPFCDNCYQAAFNLLGNSGDWLLVWRRNDNQVRMIERPLKQLDPVSGRSAMRNGQSRKKR